MSLLGGLGGVCGLFRVALLLVLGGNREVGIDLMQVSERHQSVSRP